MLLGIMLLTSCGKTDHQDQASVATEQTFEDSRQTTEEPAEIVGGSEESTEAAAKFRKFLIKDGYNMMQWSVYSRICNGTDSVAMHRQRLKQNLPENGSVRALTLTEKQFESIDVLLGEKTFADSPESTELINIF